jgi:hypothetical protein
LHQPTPVPSGLEADAILGSIKGAVADGYIADPARRVAADGKPVPRAESASGDRDPGGHGGRTADGDHIVPVADIAVFDVDVGPRHVHAVGVGRDVGRAGIGLEHRNAADEDVGIPAVLLVGKGRVLEPDAHHGHARAIAEGDHRPRTDHRVVRDKGRPPGLPLPVDGAAPGDRDVLAVADGDEIRRVGGAPVVGSHGFHLKRCPRRQLEVDVVAGESEVTAQVGPGSRRDQHNPTAGRVGRVKGVLDGRGVIGGAVPHRPIGGDIECGLGEHPHR